MSYTKEEIKGAVYLMAHSDDYDRVKSDAEHLAKTDHGWFAGADAVFNPVVQMIRTVSESVRKAVWRLCSRRRAEVGLKDKKSEYQRQYMNNKRRRTRAAANLKSQLDGVNLKGEQLQEYRREVNALWVYHCNQFSSCIRPGRKYKELRSEFWEAIDAHLDLALGGDVHARLQVLGEDNERWLESFHGMGFA